MLTLLNIFLIFGTGLLCILVSFFIIQVVFALRRNRDKPTLVKRHPGIAVLMPAHNEAEIIAETLVAIQSDLPAECRLVVIADNCSDDTAKIVRKAGVEVITRDDPDRQGKGFALQYGVDHLADDPPEIIVIIDADCRVQKGAVERLADMAMEIRRPAQALYLMLPHESAGIGQQVAAFAFVVKNHVRLLGLKRMGLPCHLVGTGMAFPWQVIKSIEFGTGNIVEDMKLGADLVCLGLPAQFCPQAVVTSKFPETAQGLMSQRTRWEHGHLQIILSQVPKLALDCLKRRDWRGLCFALDLAIPPLTLLVYLLIVGLGITAGAVFVGASSIAFIILFGFASAFGLSIIFAWWRYGRKLLPAKSLRAIPAYVLPKILLYLRFIKQRQKDWVRTDRR